jgi:hypothetical protein
MRPPIRTTRSADLTRSRSFGIWTDAEIAGVAGIERVEEMQAAKRGADRERKFLREARDAVRGGLRPSAAAEDQDRRAGRTEELRQFRHLGGSRRGLDRRECRRIRRGDALDQHVLRQADYDRSRPSVRRGVKRARDDLRYACGIVDLRRPFGHRAEHGAVVEFLEGLALAHLARDLADEHHERRRILTRDVDAGRRVGGARSAGDETDARAAGHLADRLRHHRGAALLPANGDGKIAVVKRIENRQVALARHAEDVAHAVNAQLIDQNLGRGPHIVLTAHRRLPGNSRPIRRAGGVNVDCRDRRR